MNNDKKNQENIGKGLRSLLQSIDKDIVRNPSNKNILNEIVGSRILIDDISINPKQPRKDFDEKALLELSSSIKIHDIIQPITVSKLINGKYQLISGERRLKAAKLAGLKDIPAYIKKVNDSDLLELALLENLQRENLNAIEVALSYKRMMDELNYTQEKIAERMGKERSTVNHYIRLLKLPPAIQSAVQLGKITMGHARALINVEDVEKQLYMFQEIQNKELSVRQAEDLARNFGKTPDKKGKPQKIKSEAVNSTYKKIEDKLCHHFETKVVLTHHKNGYGNILIEYYTLQDLNNILEKLKLHVQ